MGNVSSLVFLSVLGIDDTGLGVKIFHSFEHSEDFTLLSAYWYTFIYKLTRN